MIEIGIIIGICLDRLFLYLTNQTIVHAEDRLKQIENQLAQLDEHLQDRQG